MTSPYDGPRAAVAAWSTSPTSPAATSSPDSPASAGDAFLPNVPAVGVYRASLGALVATYPGVGYARWLDWVSVKCSEADIVEIYVGAISDIGRLSSYGDGSLSEYDPNKSRYIPQGAPVFVVWYVSSATQTSSAVAGFRQA